MKYNLFNWKTIVGALFLYGGGKEIIDTWNQFHSFKPAVIGAIAVTLIALILFIKGMTTKKRNQPLK